MAYEVHARYDVEDQLWTADSRALPGLDVRAENLEELESALRRRAGEILRGQGDPAADDPPLRIRTHGFPACGC
jgi:hypothetical protein